MGLIDNLAKAVSGEAQAILIPPQPPKINVDGEILEVFNFVGKLVPFTREGNRNDMVPLLDKLIDHLKEVKLGYLSERESLHEVLAQTEAYKLELSKKDKNVATLEDMAALSARVKEQIGEKKAE